MFNKINKHVVYSVLFGSILCTILGFLIVYHLGSEYRVFIDLGKAFMEKRLSPLNFALVLSVPIFTVSLVYTGLIFTFYFESIDGENDNLKKIKKRRKKSSE